MRPVGRLCWIAIAVAASGISPKEASGSDRHPERAQVALGRELFFDERMSADGKISCATCHRPESGFSGALPTPTGVYGRTLTRNPPSLANAARPKRYFWDGRGEELESIAFNAYLDPNEFGNESAAEVINRIARNHADSYARAFPGKKVEPALIGRALGAYLRELRVEDSPFDRFQAGDVRALTDSQKRGFKIFTGIGECSRCHLVQANHATFSDEKTHWGDIAVETKPKLIALAREMKALDEAERIEAMASRPEVSALGRYLITLDPEDIGRFVTPSLRNVALTAPYMHDGKVPTLREAVEREIYYRARENRTLGKLTPEEREDLVAFLESLTSQRVVVEALAAREERSTP